MRFISKKPCVTVIDSNLNQCNVDQLSQGASLKAAQAIFKKHINRTNNAKKITSDNNTILHTEIRLKSSKVNRNYPVSLRNSVSKSPIKCQYEVGNSHSTPSLDKYSGSNNGSSELLRQSEVKTFQTNSLRPVSISSSFSTSISQNESIPSAGPHILNSYSHKSNSSLLISSFIQPGNDKCENEDKKVKPYTLSTFHDKKIVLSDQKISISSSKPLDISNKSLKKLNVKSSKTVEDKSLLLPKDLSNKIVPMKVVHPMILNCDKSLEKNYFHYSNNVHPSELNERNNSDNYIKLNGINKNKKIHTSDSVPNLIPNYQRRLRKSKISRLFGKKVTIPETHEISKQRVKLKTTMRSKSQDNCEKLNDTYFHNVYETYSDTTDDSDSLNEYYPYHKNQDIYKKTLGKRKRIKNHVIRHKNSFNEDKPWKSHLDIGFVSQKERIRYEGVWVSNKDSYLELLNYKIGIYPEDGLMLNIIVMDTWLRSNLPTDTLAQIYDKVDTRHDGTLDRKSFVVGMWLIDQCLYGRKLPKELDQRVWDSVDKYVISIPDGNPRHHHRTKKKILQKELKSIKRDMKLLQL